MQTDNIFIIHPDTTEQMDALIAFVKALKIKYELTNEKAYNADFVAKIEKSRQDYKNGKGKVMTMDELNQLWK
jgi:hypothetical protein